MTVMKEVYDIVNKEYIRANTVKELCDKIGVDSSSFYRLRNGFTKTLNHRYLLNHEEGFIRELLMKPAREIVGDGEG